MNQNNNHLNGLDKLLAPLLKYPRFYLSILLILLLAVPLISNYLSEKPLIMGPESYYHLYQSQHLDSYTLHYYPLNLITSYLPESLLFLIPIIISLSTLWLGYQLGRKLEVSEKFLFLFSLFLIATPIFIFTSITFSSYNIFLFFLVLGFYILTLDHPYLRYLSIIPFLLTTLLDLTSSLFVLILLLIYYWNNHHRSLEQKRLLLVVMLITLVSAILAKFILHLQLVLGPFHIVHPLTELISDLGGESGIPFFTLLLAFLSVSFSWKEKRYQSAYFPLILVIGAYVLNQHFLFPLLLMIVFFATIGFIHIFESSWALPSLKKFTLLILLLGIAFSLTTYFNRVSEIGPTDTEVQTLKWIGDNYSNNTIHQRVFSAPENSYYIAYFSQLRPLYDYHLTQENKVWVELTKQLIESTYISTTFPLLEMYDVYILYITPEMRKTYLDDQGILFVLKNERFKMVHSQEEVEVWVFE